MSWHRLPRRWCLSAAGLVAVAVAVPLISWQATVAKENPSASEDSRSEFRVHLPDRLSAVPGRSSIYSAKLRITKTSQGPSRGPVYLVVEGTTPESLEVLKADGTTEKDEPVFEVVSPEGLVRRAGLSKLKTIQFRSQDSLSQRARGQFQLDYRVTRDAEVQREESRDVPPTARRSGSRNRESRGGGRSGSGGDKSGTSEPDDEADADSEPSRPADNAGRPEPFTLKPDITDADVEKVMGIQDAATPKLLKTEGVVGTATGVNAEGDLVIRVYTERHGIAKELPEKIEGIPVDMRVTGKFRPFQPPQDKRGHAGVRPEPPEVEDPQQRFDRPVPIGVSGMNRTLGGGLCGTGTIGCRVRAEDGTLYALSNNHVFADENNAPIGDNILQPGPLDNNCVFDLNNSIGTLAAFVPIDFTGQPNRVDAALAEVTEETLGNSTPDGSYGTPNSHTVEPELGMKVQKMGRTTSYTTGRIISLNATIPVGYTTGLALFEDQIIISHPILVIDADTGQTTISLQSFSGPGDSGSLVVTSGPHRKNPVGLLFAGNAIITAANPINIVLGELGNEVGQELTIDGLPSNAEDR